MSTNSSAFVRCPGCGLVLADQGLEPGDRYNASGECLQMFSDLVCYTVAKGDSAFIHQHVVDAYGAQHVGAGTRPIGAVFTLVGLYLTVEKGYTGRQVQLAHMKIGRTRHAWPRLEPPERPAVLTVQDVLNAGTDAEKDEAILRWAASVWKSWEHRHAWVRETTERVLFHKGPRGLPGLRD